MRKLGLIITIAVGTGIYLQAGKIGDVVSLTPQEDGTTPQSQSGSVGAVIPMVKILPNKAVSQDLLKRISTQISKRKKNGISLKTGGGPNVGTQEDSLETGLPLVDFSKSQDIRSMEYGVDAGGGAIPYSTSRVDMYAKLNKISFSKKYPFSASGQLFFDNPLDGSSYVCSASMIKRGVLVTAAHCVADYANETLYENFLYVPARKNKTAPYGTWTAAKVYLKYSYYNGSNSECDEYGVICRNDVAVIVLNPKNGKYVGDFTGWYSYGINTYSYFDNAVAQITQLGYPVSHDQGKLMQRNDSIGAKVYATDDENGKKIYQTLIGSRMTGGSSGGPWIVNFGQRSKLSGGVRFGKEAKSNVVVGVTSWGFQDQAYKIMGASLFTKNNIGALVKEACQDYPNACR